MPEPTIHDRLNEWEEAFRDQLRFYVAKLEEGQVADWRHVDRVALWVCSISGWHPPTPRNDTSDGGDTEDRHV